MFSVTELGRAVPRMLGSPAGPGGPSQRGLWPVAPAPAPSATSFSTDGMYLKKFPGANKYYVIYFTAQLSWETVSLKGFVNKNALCLMFFFRLQHNGIIEHFLYMVVERTSLNMYLFFRKLGLITQKGVQVAKKSHTDCFVQQL